MQVTPPDDSATFPLKSACEKSRVTVEEIVMPPSVVLDPVHVSVVPEQVQPMSFVDGTHPPPSHGHDTVGGIPRTLVGGHCELFAAAGVIVSM